LIIISSLINYYQLGKSSRTNDFIVESWVKNTIDVLPDSSILLVDGDELTFPMFYNNIVRKNNKNLIVINRSMMKIDWYKQYLKKHFDLDADLFLKQLKAGKAKNVFSESILHEFSAYNYFNNYAHLYKIEQSKRLRIDKNKILWKNIRFPLYTPLDNGEKRIKSLYSENLKNYAIELSESLRFSDASYYGSLSSSIINNYNIKILNKNIRKFSTLYEHYLKLPINSKKRLDIALKINSPILIEKESGREFSQTGKFIALKLYLNSLIRQKKWDYYISLCNSLSSEKIRITELLRLYLLLEDKSKCNKLIMEWDRKYKDDKAIILLKAQYFILKNDFTSLEDILKTLPENADGNNFRALYYFKKGHLKRAYSLWSSIINKDPENLQAKLGIRKIKGPTLGKI